MVELGIWMTGRHSINNLRPKESIPEGGRLGSSRWQSKCRLLYGCIPIRMGSNPGGPQYPSTSKKYTSQTRNTKGVLKSLKEGHKTEN